MAKKEILIVDDSPTFLKLVKTYLQTKNYEIFTACNGKEALEKLAANKPDLVILDLIMPEMQGNEVCRLMKANPQWMNIPVIMITTRGDKKGEEQCRQAGCDAFLTKPITKTRLVTTIKQFLHD